MRKYIYLDDEPVSNVRGIKRTVEREIDNLDIDHKHPLPYEAQIEQLKITSTSSNLDGLILDLRLDILYKDDDKSIDKANYRAATLAQEIRTRATEGEMPAYPIVLWSTEPKLRKSYDPDDTSHDLFDLKCVKVDFELEEYAKSVAYKLVALVDGYKFITSLRNSVSTQPHNYLGFENKPVFLDDRIYVHLRNQQGALPTHEYARFLVREMLETAGPLVDRNHLAARLGIDLDQSAGFDQLVDKLFADAAYSGPFSSGWPAWWFALVDDSWRKLSSVPGPLRNLPAQQRVDFLKSISGISELVADKNSWDNERTTFWTICQATLKPLDPRDGYLISKQPKFPWQDREYVSFDAVLTKAIDDKKIKIDVLEEDRFKRTRAKLGV